MQSVLGKPAHAANAKLYTSRRAGWMRVHVQKQYMHFELLQGSLSDLSFRSLELLLRVNVALLHVEECIFVVLHQPQACISAAI